MRHMLLAIIIAFNCAIGLATTGGAQESAEQSAVTALALPAIPLFNGEGSGTLKANTKNGEVVFPLKHTDVSATISGHIARVTVKQSFENPLNDIMEAVYTFPLSDSAAVDDMLMKIGDRTIHGTIKKKEDARQIYEKARAEGHTAALLDQERPNIFTQSVANIPPHKNVDVIVTYVDMLPYDDGKYTFAFPTVVGPRFNPSTAAVPDAAKITPPFVPNGERNGNDISISVDVDSPVSIGDVASPSHQVASTKLNDHHYKVVLQNKAAIPNKDYVLSWNVADNQIKSGYLVNAQDGHGYFNIAFIPPKRPTATQIQPKEMVFLIDASGSQHGAPMQKAKEVMQYSIDHLNAQDTFQIVSFNNVVSYLFEKPRIASTANRDAAKAYLQQLEANGGTWMAPAVEAVCAIPTDEHRLRIVSFMTDGFIGNDFQVIGLIQKLRKTSRWFPFGTGNSVNRFLIDNIAKAGGGEPDYVYLNSSAAEAGKKFYAKIASPVLTDVDVDFDGLKVKDVYPRGLADVWAQRPLYITGRFVEPGKGTVHIKGFSGGKPYSEALNVVLPQNEPQNASLGSLWARAFVDYMTSQDWVSHQPGAPSSAANRELKDEITRVALDHHIMTQYTSFVAVEEQTKVEGGKKVTVEVPVEVPEGVDRNYVEAGKANSAAVSSSPAASSIPTGAGFGTAGGSVAARDSSAGGASGGIVNSSPAPMQMLSSGSTKQDKLEATSRSVSQNAANYAGSNLPHIHRARQLVSRTDLELQQAEEKAARVSDEQVARLAKLKLSPELLKWFSEAKDGSLHIQINFDDPANIPRGWDPTARIIFAPPSLIMNVDRHGLRYYLTLEHVKSIVIFAHAGGNG